MPLPGPVETVLVRDAQDWWFHFTCRCRSVDLPLRLMTLEGHGDQLIPQAARRLRCRACGSRPLSVVLLDDPAAGAEGCPGEPATRHQLLGDPL